MKKTSFCIISPFSCLEKYSSLSDHHMALAHLVEHSDLYSSFYKSKSNKGEFVIMDCSAFELGQSYPPEKLIELGHKCGATILVLPDYPFCKSSITINAALNWVDEVRSEGFKTMFVPQSEKGDLEDWIRGYVWATENNHKIDLIGMSILGIPNAIPHIKKLYARVVMVSILQERGIFNFSQHHHFLGLNSPANIEIPSLIAMNALDTCDSSNPVWAGLKGYKYNKSGDSFLNVKKQVLGEVDFHFCENISDEVNEIVKHNLQLTLDVFNNSSNYME